MNNLIVVNDVSQIQYTASVTKADMSCVHSEPQQDYQLSHKPHILVWKATKMLDT